MLSVRNLSLSFPGKVIFDQVDFSVGYSQKVGIVGRNGAGKSTLLKVLSGSLKPDSGSITYNQKKAIAYLPQELVMQSDKTVIAEVRSVFDTFMQLQDEVVVLERELQAGASAQQAEKLIERYSAAQEQLAHFDPSEIATNIQEVLTGLGFTQERQNTLVTNLSVGWQMRVVLAKLLLTKADLYFFDEPTNHLDLPAKEWFIQFLRNASFGYLLVTHDRYFLQKACNSIIELERGKAITFTGNFDDYVTQKEQQQEKVQAAYVQQQKEIARKQATINRFRASASKAAMVQNMIKQLNAMEKIELEQTLPEVQFSFPEVVRAGRTALELANVSHAYGQHQIFNNVSFELARGKKAALIAPNGVGKTTLFNVIVGKLAPQIGSVTFGHNVSHAYFEQDQARVLNEKNSILDEVIYNCSHVPEVAIRSMLGAFLFPGDDVNKKIKMLSGGERNRVAMVKVLLQKANLLLLDEPTNHLDMFSKEVLLQALTQYQGTMLFVSHDHYFVEQLADQILALSAHGLHVYDGDYESYLYFKQQQEQHHETQRSYKTGKQCEKNVAVQGKQNAKEVRKLERTISKLESQQEELHTKLAQLRYGSDEYTNIMQQLNQVQKELLAVEQQWEALLS